MRHSMVLLAVLLSMTGCKVMHHTKAAMHHEPPASHGYAGAGQPSYNLPPASMLMHPGPGVDGPGPGVLMPEPHHSRHDEYLANYRRTGVTHILNRTREFQVKRKDGDGFA